MTRTERIAFYLREETLQFLSSDLSRTSAFETAEAARALKLDRANVSKLLNELWNGGRAVKIQGRPTLYLSHRVLSAALPGQFIPATLGNVEELRVLLRGAPPPAPGQEDPPAASGAVQLALREALSVCSYPPYGLPLLLVSPSHQDAEVFVRQVFDQIRKDRPAGAQLITVDCRGSLHGEDRFLRKLFGFAREVSPSGHAGKSCFELSNHGLVCLDGVQRLPDHILEALLAAVDRGSYCRIGETVPRKLDTTLVFSLPPQSGEELLSRLGKHIPYRQDISPLDSRGVNEKLNLLLDALTQESTAVGRPLRVSKDALAYLLSAPYPAGISELQTVVRLLCASVFQLPGTGGQAYMELECRNLPQGVISGAEAQPVRLARALRLVSLVPNDFLFFFPGNPNSARSLFRDLYLRTGSLDAMPDDQLFYPGRDQLLDPQRYIGDLLSYLRGCESGQIAQLQKWIPHYVLQGAERLLSRREAGRPLTGNPALSLGILVLMQGVSLQRRRLELPEGGLPAPDREDAQLCEELFSLFSAQDGFALSPGETAFFSAYLKAARALSGRGNVSLLLVLHGGTVAQQYTRFLRQNSSAGLVVDGIDVAPGESLASVTARSAEAAQALHRGEGVLVAVDLPSLLSVAPAVSGQTGIPCRAVGDISLADLLSLAQQCSAGASLADLIAGEPERVYEEAKVPQMGDPFMRRYFRESFTPDLAFLDPAKALQVLTPALTGILEDLRLPYSHEIAIKFYAHSSHMLERVITSNAMSFPNLRRFLADNRATAAVVEHQLEPAANTFGITIPAAEIAYIVEIFRQYE